MPMDTLSLATTTPNDEPCEQLGPDYRPYRAICEGRAFIHQLQRQFGPPPNGCMFILQRCRHDFGTYLDVALHFDADQPAAVEYAFRVEGNLPDRWDADALTELAQLVADAKERAC